MNGNDCSEDAKLEGAGTGAVRPYGPQQAESDQGRKMRVRPEAIRVGWRAGIRWRYALADGVVRKAPVDAGKELTFIYFR